MAKVLVAYYSRKGENYMPGGNQVLPKGHTAYAAEFISAALDADIFEMDTVKPYADGYKECCMQAVQEVKTNARPELQRFVEDISGYDTVFVCFPCWCGTAPMCVFTFLEHYDLTGKKIVPVCTHEGSGLANAPKDIQKACPGAVVAEGLAIRGHQVKDSREQIASWAKSAAAQ